MLFLCPPAFNKGRVFGTALTTVSLTTFLMIFLPTVFAVEWLIILLRTTEAPVSNFAVMAEVFAVLFSYFSRDGIVCKWPNYWLDDPVFNFRQGQQIFLFPQNTQTGPGTRSASYWMSVVIPSSGIKGRDMMFHLVKRLDFVEIYSCSPVWL